MTAADDAPQVRGTYPLVRIGADGVVRWLVIGSTLTGAPVWREEPQLSARLRRRWVQLELWEAA